MKQHYSEADLLETYYMKPGESLPVMMHLADCPDCAARYEKLEGKMRALTACPNANAHLGCDRPETFWAKQRSAILRRVAEERRATPFARMAAAAALVFVLAGTLSWQFMDATLPVPQPQPDIAAESSIVSDPWESGELDDLHPIVEWESWVENGGQS